MNGELESLQRKDKWTEEDKARIRELQSSKSKKQLPEARASYAGPTVEETMARIEKDFS